VKHLAMPTVHRVKRTHGPTEALVYGLVVRLDRGSLSNPRNAADVLNRAWFHSFSMEHPGVHLRFDALGGVGRERLLYAAVLRDGLSLGYYVGLDSPCVITPNTIDAVAARDAAIVLES